MHCIVLKKALYSTKNALYNTKKALYSTKKALQSSAMPLNYAGTVHIAAWSTKYHHIIHALPRAGPFAVQNTALQCIAVSAL